MIRSPVGTRDICPATLVMVAAFSQYRTAALGMLSRGLKAVIRRKWGDAAPISKAITAIEEDPKSKVQAAVLEEKVAVVKAAEDAEVVKALHQLVEQMKTHGIGGEVVTGIKFDMSGGVVQGVAGAENVQIGSMIFAA
jgi:hypothetical protein